MTLQEFAKLKVGDKIALALNGNEAEVVETTDAGVRIVWLPRHPHETRFFYSVNSTAWMQWDRIVEAVETRKDGIA